MEKIMEKKKFREKKSFYQVRHYRLSDRNADWLKTKKGGTWNRTFDKLRRINK